MIDINDPRNEHILAHPHFLSGIEHECERITALLKSAVISAEDANYLIALIKGENK